MSTFVTRDVLNTALSTIDAAFARPGRLYLIGETSLLHEGWRIFVDCIELAAEVEDTDAFEAALQQVRDQLGVTIYHEPPGDIIPLPEGHEERNRPVETAGLTHLNLFHFDPFSVAFRFIARGDEPDYHLVLSYVEHGWVTMDKMEALLEELLPRFSMQTIQQDPAEFRRKYKGLLQMQQSVGAGTIHRHTPA